MSAIASGLRSLAALVALLALTALAVGSETSSAIPSITVTKIDSTDPGTLCTQDGGLIVDNDGDGAADPGDTLRYAVCVVNSGTTDASGSTFADTIDSNTTLIPGSLRTTPIARNDSYTSNGNVGISVPAASGVLTNDNDPDGTTPTLAIFSFAATSANGGDVSVASDGSFTYDPAPGFEGSDSFTYTIQDTDGNIDPATVFITVSDMIWFIDNSAGSGGDGRLGSPFNSLADYNSTAADDPGDAVFFYESGSGDYTGGITLQSNQLLIGQGATASLAGIAGITPPAHSNTLPATGGARPVIANGGGHGVTLAANNLARGLNVGNTSGSGFIDGGGSVGTLTISEVSITGSGGGIEADNSGTLAVTFDSLSASSSTDEGIHLASVAGSFTVSDGSISTTGLPAVDINSGASVALNVTLDSVSASSGGNGIRLQNTTGSFTVTGSGPCTASTPTCGGGRIQNMTGANGAVAGNGVYLNNAQGVSLNFMRLNDFQNHAIFGSSVDGFTLDDSYVHGTNGNSAGDDEGSIRFVNLLGSASISGSHIEGGLEDNVRVVNDTGTLNRLTVDDSTIGPNDTTLGNDGVLVEANLSATLNVTVSNSTFTSARGDLLQLNANNGSTMDWVVTGNTFSNNHPSIVSGGGGVTLSGDGGGSTANVTYDVSDNTFRDAVGIALNVFKGSGGGTFEGEIINNTIGVFGTVFSGSAQGSGIQVTGNGTGTHTVLIQDNEINEYNEQGILLRANDGSSTMNATITGNTIRHSQTGASGEFIQNGLHLNIGATSTDTNSACADIQNNTMSGSGGPFADPDFNLRQRFLTTIQLPGYGGASNDNAAVVSFIQGQNVGTPTGTASNNVSGGGGGFTDGATSCPQPVVSASPLGSGTVVTRSEAPSRSLSYSLAASAIAPALGYGSDDGALAMAFPSRQRMSRHTALTSARDLVSGVTEGDAGPASPAASGETINVTLGTLDPGQTVTITFDVTVDSTIPSNVTQVCNQGILSGSNFADVVTDDPDVGGAFDPTCTEVPQADLRIDKSDSADPVTPSAAYSYSVTVNNDGPSTAQDVSVTDTLPAGVTFVSTSGCTNDPSGVPTCQLGSISSGASKSYTINVTAPGTSGTITNTASVTSTTHDPDTSDNSATEDTDVIPPTDLAITKTDGSATAVPGTAVIYTITVTNNGPTGVTGATVADTFPAALSGVSWTCSASGGATCTAAGGGDINDSVDIPVAGSVTYTVMGDIDPSATGTLSNTATVTAPADVIDTDSTNDSATDTDTLTPEADLSITKSDSADPVLPGNQFSYTVTVNNNGPSDAQSVSVSDTPPSGLTFVSTAGCAEDPGGVPTCSLGTIAAGGSAQYTITVDVDASPPDTVTNTASVSSGTPDPDTGNNSASEATTLNQPPEIVDIDPSTQTVQYSDKITPIEVTVFDSGTSALSLSTAAPLPSDLSISPAGSQDPISDCTAVTGGYECTWTVSGQMQENAGSYDIDLQASDGSLSSDEETATINVDAEDARVSFDVANPIAVEVASAGGDSGPFSLTFDVWEFDDPNNVVSDDNLAGYITLADVSMSLVPVGPGSTVSPSATCTETAGPSVPDSESTWDYDTRRITCPFAGVDVNTYSVQVDVNLTGYYEGFGEDVLTVFDPSLGFTTGGGWFYWPGSENPGSGYPGDRTKFGYNAKYNKNGTNVQGNLLVIRTLPDGSIFRLKSNAFQGLSVGEAGNLNGTFGWAAFNGKATYQEPGWPDPIGNYTFIVYVEDHGEPGAAADRFWIQVRDRDGNVVDALSLPTPGSTSSATIEGGNIVVPHKSKGRGGGAR